MQMNDKFNQRRGAGCPPGEGMAGEGPAAAEFEVLPPMARADPSLTIGRVSFNRDTTLNSPCFWLLGGLAIGAFACWYMTRDNRR